MRPAPDISRAYHQPAYLAVQIPVVAAAGILTAFGAWLASSEGPRMVVLLALGGAIGLTLYHATFGFAAAYRRFFLYRDGRGIGAQLALVALGTVSIAPTLALTPETGQMLVAAAAPVGVQVAVGAALFGIGMQLGGGCGSGTLFTVGGGSVRMVATLFAFCTGSFLASLQLDWWSRLPSIPEVVLIDEFGWPVAVAGQLGFIALLYALLRRLRRASPAASFVSGGSSLGVQLIRGRWPILWGVMALALLNWLTLLVAGHPWAITWGFTLWGAKAAEAAGWSASQSPFWSGGYAERALSGGVFADTVSTMNIGIMLGALLAAGLAGRFSPSVRITPLSMLAAVGGGLMMGYGARISFGCNIGAFVSGVSSTSLHGWLWVASAFAATWFGIRLRPIFGLNEPDR